MPSTADLNRRIVFSKRPNGMPTVDCFQLEHIPLEQPGPNQALVHNHYLSLDPYIRMRMEDGDSDPAVMQLGDVLAGRTVGKVVASGIAGVEPGDWVVGRLGWQDYSLANAGDLQKIDAQVAPPAAYLGSLGST